MDTEGNDVRIATPITILLATCIINLAACQQPQVTSKPAPIIKPEPRWIVDSISGCLLWNPLPQPMERVLWSGPCRDGVANGFGVVQWYSDGTPTQRYEGDIRAGKYHGRGKDIAADGFRYEGDWRNGKPHGKGRVVDTSGNSYEGDIVNGKRHGKGTMIYATGGRYEGAFVNGVAHGKGVISFADGTRFDGDFTDGLAHGLGVLRDPQGGESRCEFNKGEVVRCIRRPGQET